MSPSDLLVFAVDQQIPPPFLTDFFPLEDTFETIIWSEKGGNRGTENPENILKGEYTPLPHPGDGRTEVLEE